MTGDTLQYSIIFFPGEKLYLTDFIKEQRKFARTKYI